MGRDRNNPPMVQKPEGHKNDATFQFRCRKAELKEFARCAEAEGFISVAAWMLWHLRKVVRESKS